MSHIQAPKTEVEVVECFEIGRVAGGKILPQVVPTPREVGKSTFFVQAARVQTNNIGRKVRKCRVLGTFWYNDKPKGYVSILAVPDELPEGRINDWTDEKSAKELAHWLNKLYQGEDSHYQIDWVGLRPVIRVNTIAVLTPCLIS